MAQAQAIINVALNTSQVAAQLRALQTQINAFSNSLNKGNILQANEAKRFQQQLLDTVNTSRFFTAELVKMRSAASTLDATLSKGQATMAQYFSARFLKNSSAAAQVMSLANARAKSLETQFIATSGAAAGFREAVAVRPISAFSDAVTVNSQKLAIHRAMLRQATTSMINFGKNTQWAGRQLMVGFTVPLTIFAAAAGKTFRDVERQAVQFKKVYGDIFTPPEEMQENLNAVTELAKEFTKYGISLKDTLGLAAEAAAAGSRNAALTDAVTAATRLATLGQMEQAQALETTIALQNAFKLQGEELADAINYLNMVENQTVVTLQDLAAAIPRVAPVVKGLGGDVRDLAAFMAAMQEGGVSAEQGANALKSGLASLINPTDRASEKLKEMGININEIIQTNRGDLMATVQAFSLALNTLDEFQRQQALEQVFGKFQYARLGALFANITKEGSQAAQALQLAQYSSEELAKSAEKELSIIEESFGVKFTAAVERFKIALMPIGEMFTKLAIPLINFASKIAEAFNNLPDFAKNFIGLATVIGGIVVPAGTMFLGLIFNLIGTLVKFGHIVGVAFKGFMTGGIKGGIAGVSQSLSYMSLREMDASIAAVQLRDSTNFVNDALLRQATAADTAKAAVMELTAMYEILSRTMVESAAMMPATMFVPGTAAKAAAKATKVVPKNIGGTIPGFGQNKDTVPAMLTPGEYVVNREATKKNLDLLHAINSGQFRQYNGGGFVDMETIDANDLQSRRLQEQSAQLKTRAFVTEKEFSRITGISSGSVSRLKREYLKEIGNKLESKMSGEQAAELLLFYDNKQKEQKFSDAHLYPTGQRKIIGQSGIAIDQDFLDRKYRGTQFHALAMASQLGIPVEQLDDYTIKLSHKLNVDLSKDGALGSEIKEYLEEVRKLKTPILGGALKRANVNQDALISNLLNTIDDNVRYKDFGDPSRRNVFGALVDNTIRSMGLNIQPKNTLLRLGRIKDLEDIDNSHKQAIAMARRNYNIEQKVPGTDFGYIYKKEGKKAKLSLTFQGHELMSSGTRQVPSMRILKRNYGGLIQHLNGGGISKAVQIPRPLAMAAWGGKYPPLFSPAIPGTRMYGFGEGARQPMMRGASGKPTTLMDLIRQVSTDPRFGERLQARVLINGQEAVINRIGSRQIERLARGTSSTPISLETRPITKAREQQFMQQWEAAGKPGMTRGNNFSEYRAFEDFMLKKGYHRNQTQGYFYKPLKIGLNDPILGEVLMPRSMMGTQQQEFNIPPQRFMAGGIVFSRAQIQKIVSKLGPEEARRYFAEMQTSAADQKVINSVISRTAQKMAPAFMKRQAMTVSDMDKNFDSFKWTRLSGKYVLSENAVNSMLRSGQRVVYYPDLRTGQLQDALNNDRFVVTRKGSRLVFKNQFGLETTLPKSADGKYNVFSPDEIFYANQGGMAFNSSRRNIVPGMGNKDTVPAVLTPGEFVINKDATKQNIDLLHAINSGKMASMNVGGQIIPIQEFKKGGEVKEVYDKKTGQKSGYVAYGEDGQRIGFFRSKSQAKAALRPPGGNMMRGLGVSTAIGAVGMGAMIYGQQLQSEAMARGEESRTGGFLSQAGIAAQMASILPFLGPKGLVVAGFAAIAAGVVGLVKAFNDVKNSAANFNKQMYGSAELIDRVGKALGRQTASQQAGFLQSLKTTDVTEETMGFAQQFMTTDAGKTMLKDIQTLKREGADTIKALRNQLASLMLSGLITKQEANAIAIEIGSQLNDADLSLGVNAQIERLVGPNGENLSGKEVVDIFAEISASLDQQEVSALVEDRFNKATKYIDWGAGLSVDKGLAGIDQFVKAIVSNLTPNMKEIMEMQVYAEAMADNAEKEKQARAAIELSLKNGNITAQEYLSAIKEINLQSTETDNNFNAAVNKLEEATGLAREEGLGSATVRNIKSQVDRLTSAIDTEFNDFAEKTLSKSTQQGINELGDRLARVNSVTGSPDALEKSQLQADIMRGAISEPILAKAMELDDEEIEKLGITSDKLVEMSSQLGIISRYPSLSEKAVGFLFYQQPPNYNLDKLNKQLLEIETIPPVMSKALKLDIDGMSADEIAKWAREAGDISSLWPALQKLPPQIDLGIFLQATMRDADGNIVDPYTMAENVVRMNKAFVDLQSNDKNKVVKAELEIAAIYGERRNLSPDEALSLAKSVVKNWNNLKPETKVAVIDISIRLGQIQARIRQIVDYAKNLIGEERRFANQAVGLLTGEGGKLEKQIQGFEAGDLAENIDDKDGAGEKTESLSKELARRAEEARKQFEATNNIFKNNKEILAGPFGPEFIAYVQSQGKRFVELVEEGTAAVKKAYQNYLEEQKIFSTQAFKNLPAQLASESKISAKREKLIQRFMKQGKMTRKEAEQTASKFNDTMILTQKLDVLFGQGMSNFNKYIDPQNMRDLDIAISNAFDPSKFKAIQDFVSRGIPREFAVMLADQNLEAGTATSQLNKYVSMIKEFEQAQWNALEPLERANKLIGLQIEELDMMRQIELTERIKPLQDQVNSLQETNEKISRTIELEQRRIEPIQEAIEKLEEEKSLIEERYDNEQEALEEAYEARISALSTIENINARIAQQQQNQIGLASALSRGDIVAAAQAALQMQRDDAAARMEDARSALEEQKQLELKQIEISREKEIDAIQQQINVKKSEQEIIEKNIKDLQLQQRDISDQIYIIELNIDNITKEINNKYNTGNLELESQKNKLIQIRQELEKIRSLANAAPSVSANTVQMVSPSQPTYHPAATGQAPPPPQGEWVYEYDEVSDTVRPTWAFKPMAYGGMISYKGSREPAPGMAFGGMMKKYANGSFVSGMGNTDRVPAMLMPGEYVVNKASTKRFLPLLEMLNNTKYPQLFGSKIASDFGKASFTLPEQFNANIENVGDQRVSVIDNSLRNNQYQINVTVPSTSSSADQIANAVIGKIRMIEKKQIQGVRI